MKAREKRYTRLALCHRDAWAGLWESTFVPFKTCTYDCIYCQLGVTTTKTIDRREYFPVGAVLKEIEEKLKKGFAAGLYHPVRIGGAHALQPYQ